ncbi:hypothetical protein [Amycolatopsis japonica]
MTDAKTKIAEFVEDLLTLDSWDPTPAEATDHILKLLTEAGWRPPMPKTDVGVLVGVVGGLIDEFFGDDHAEASRAAAKEILDRGYLDKAAEIGLPEPVVTTLRRVIHDLEGEAIRLDGQSRDIGGGFTEQRIDHIIGAQTLRDYAERLRQHPVLSVSVSSVEGDA